jgi:hypothetical protein
VAVIYKKTIVVLANSWKHSGRCIAGREYTGRTFGTWIRPVSDRNGEEVNEEERQFSDGTEPTLLDVVSMGLLSAKPHTYQQENHLFDPTCYWEKQGRVGWTDLQTAVDEPKGPLWLNGHSSSNGINDQVPEASATACAGSLYLVRPQGLVIVVQREYQDKMKVRARFSLHGADYTLTVTDPVARKKFQAKGVGETKIAHALLCVSLGELFNGNAYKLVASVITPQPAGA